MSRSAVNIATVLAPIRNDSSASATSREMSSTAVPSARKRRTPTRPEPETSARGCSSAPAVTIRLSLSRSGERKNRTARTSDATMNVVSAVRRQRSEAIALRARRLSVSER